MGGLGATVATGHEGKHQGGPMFGALGPHPTGLAHSEGNAHHIGALNPAGGGWER